MTLQKNNKMENAIIKTILTMTIGLGISILLNISSVLAQPELKEILPLVEEDYPCMQQLNCVINNKELQEKGWVVQFDETIKDFPQARTARMKGDRINFTAHYDKDGSLLKGTYKLQNSALPINLLAHLASDTFDGWKMIGNEITVLDFNVASTVYDIVLESETDKMTLSFSYADVLNLPSGKDGILVKNQ